MCRLVLACAGHTYHIVGNFMSRLKCRFTVVEFTKCLSEHTVKILPCLTMPFWQAASVQILELYHILCYCTVSYAKTCVKRPLSKRRKIGFLDQYRLMQVKSKAESAILSTFIKLPFVIKIFVLSIFEWPFYKGFTVYYHRKERSSHTFYNRPF